MNLITNLFQKKKQENPVQKKQEKSKRPFYAENYKPNLQALYSESVQRTASDFVIETFDTANGQINVAFDSFDSIDVKGLSKIYEPNFLGQEIIFTHFARKSFIGFNNCSVLSQDWLINKAISAPCIDAIAVDYDVILKDATEEDKTLITRLKEKSENKGKYYIKNICQTFAQNKRKYGQALCIPIIKDVDYSLPFNIDAVGLKSYQGMVCIEPEWVAPVLDIESTTNPLSKRFYKPTWFRLPNGKLIHYTWFIFNTYNELSDILKPTYFFGGLPLPQLLYEQVYAADKTAKEAPMLAQSKRLNYIEGNLNAFLADEEMLSQSIGLMSWLRNNWGWLFVKKDQRIGQIDTSLTDFDAVTMLGYQIVAAISGVPSARLLETSPKGWQSTGSFESDTYKQLQQGIQRIDFVPILELHYRLLAKSEYDIDKDYSCVFAEIDTPTEKERAEIKEINARTASTYIQSGVISADEERTRLREDNNSGYNALSEEIETSELDPFNDLDDDIGGSSNEQDPFSLDNDFNESDHPRNKDGEFAKAGGNNSSKSKKSGSKYDKIKNKPRKEIQLPKEEYAQVIHELNTNLTKEQKKEKILSRFIGDYRYLIENNGFNEYRIIGKDDIK